MKITITGRHLSITPALRRYLEDRAQRLDRYGVRLASGQFVLSVDKDRHSAEGVGIGRVRKMRTCIRARRMCARL